MPTNGLMRGLLRAVLGDKVLKTSALMAVAAVAAQLVGVANWAALLSNSSIISL